MTITPGKPMRRMCAAVLAVVFVAVATAGCPPDFSPYWKVDKLRVMAIQADPVVAKQGEPVTFSALVWAPDDQQIDYDWSWCPVHPPADDGYECPMDELDFDPEAESNANNDDEDDDNGDSDEDPLDLGDEETATFTNPFSEQQVRAFCEAIVAEVLDETDNEELVEMLPSDCEEGWEVSVRLEVSSGDEEIIASKRFTLWGGDEDYNKNPEFDRMQARPYAPEDLPQFIEVAGWDIAESADHDDQWVTIPDDEPLDVVENSPLQLRSLVDPDSVLEFTPSTADEPREESFDYRWFTTAGPLASSSSSYFPGSNTLEDASNTVHQMDGQQLDDDCTAFDDGACIIELWTVVRDTRLGVDWIDGRLRVQSPGGEQ